jgi:hypothetical protein
VRIRGKSARLTRLCPRWLTAHAGVEPHAAFIPVGRALFAIGPDADGEPPLTWLAVGYHDTYQ